MDDGRGGEHGRLLETFQDFGPILAVKLYRLNAEGTLRVPTLPCLDHEAMLHGGIPPHAAAYIQETQSGDLHEIVVYPAQRRIDTVLGSGFYTEVFKEARKLTKLPLTDSHGGLRAMTPEVVQELDPDSGLEPNPPPTPRDSKWSEAKTLLNSA